MGFLCSVLFYNLAKKFVQKVIQWRLMAIAKRNVRLNCLKKQMLTRLSTVPLDLHFTYARVQNATARNIHGNAPE